MWRHTIENNGETVTADVVPAQNGASFTFSGISFSPGAANVKEAIAALQSAPDLEASYEVAILQIPALGVRAIWLQDSPDLIVPTAPTRPELTSGQRYSSQDFLSALQPSARRILAADDPRKGA